MRTNLDEVDRTVRGIAGVWLLATAVSAVRAGNRMAALVAGISGLGLLQNAVVGYCGGNWLFGVDTNADPGTAE